MWPEDYYSVVDGFALLGLTRKFLALHAKNFRWCDGWCEESITFFTYSYCKGGREERPIQWKVTGDSDARGNCKGRKRGTADTMESYRRLRGAGQLRGRKRGTANTMESYRCFRRAW